MDEDASYEIDIVHRRRAPSNVNLLLTEAVRRVLLRHGVGAACIGVALVDDDEIARLNVAHLRHRGPTDVLTFDLSEGGEAIEGDIVVSVDTAAREAGHRGHAVSSELALYVVHGLLHLLGYDDATATGARRMHEREDALLTELGIGPVFATRRGRIDASCVRSDRRKPKPDGRARGTRLIKRSGA